VIAGGSFWTNAGNLSLGFSSSYNNSILVTGTSSTLGNGSDLYVGYSGSGTLTVADGGSVITKNLMIASSNGAVGALNIGALGGSDTAGTITAATIAFGAGIGTINFNQSDSTSVSVVISGSGSVNQLGTGTTVLSGSNSYSGGTTISAGTLLANNTAGSALGTSTVTVQSGGTLGGNGSLGGLVTIGNGGVLNPGTSGSGSLILSNGLTLQDGSITSLLINSTANYTSLDIGGTLTYGGVLQLNLTPYAANAVPGDAFALFSTWGGGATNTNNFSNIQVIGASITFTDHSGIWTGTDSSYNLIYQFSDATGMLTVASAVPEPSTYCLFGIGAIEMMMMLRRKKTV
jgi:T5SS/PEP-CTERM-associated repeat protein/autotransporter-associated beta strand protein